MRYREIVTELFDASLPVKWVSRNDSLWQGRFQSNGVPINLYFRRYDQAWEVAFAVDHLWADKNGIENTFLSNGLQGREALKVFSTVIAALRALLKKYKPETVGFSGSKVDGKSEFYRKMVRFLAQETHALGYEVQEYEDGADVNYFIVRKDMMIQEAFDSSLPIAWTKQDASGWEGSFKSGGVIVDVVFEAWALRGNWSVKFKTKAVNGVDVKDPYASNGLQGRGAVKVFGTVLSAVRELIAKHHPDVISFTGSKSEGKSDIYSKMMAHLSKAIALHGYEANQHESGSFTTYTLERTD